MTDRKRTLGLIFLTIFISMIGFGIVIPVLPVYAKNAPFQMSPTELGWLVGIFSLVQLFSAPLLGKFSDRIGRKPVLLVSIVGTAVGYFITGAADAVWLLFLGRIIDGASGGNIATAQACIADVTPPAERSPRAWHSSRLQYGGFYSRYHCCAGSRSRRLNSKPTRPAAKILYAWHSDACRKLSTSSNSSSRPSCCFSRT